MTSSATDKGNYVQLGQANDGAPVRHVAAGDVTSWNPSGKPVIVSPIALDMNGNGKIDVTGQTTAKDGTRSALGRTVSFDIDGDGKKDNVEWLSGSGDAMLVDNRDGNAANDMNGSRLFGDQGGKFSDGYQKLAQLDTNGDGKLTGNELKGLSLWKDNGDAVVQPGELVDAQSAGVTSISVQRHDVQNGQGATQMQSNAVINGRNTLSEDVWFGKAG